MWSSHTKPPSELTLAGLDCRIVFSSSHYPLVVTYNHTTRRHTAWAVRYRKLHTPGIEQFASEKDILSQTQPAGVVLDWLWEDSESTAQASSVFIAADEDAEPVLCIFSREAARLRAFRLQDNTFSLAFVLSALAVAC